jgi:hypothetical protein
MWPPRWQVSGRPGGAKNLAGELGWTSNVDQGGGAARAGGLRLREEGAQREVRTRGAIAGACDDGDLGRQLPPFGDPLLAAAIHEADVFVPVDLQLPQRPCGEPVVVIAIEDHGGVVADAGFLQQGLESRLRQDIAADGVG